MFDNYITSSIPEEWNTLTDLRALVLFNNRLGGPLPTLAGSQLLNDTSYNLVVGHHALKMTTSVRLPEGLKMLCIFEASRSGGSVGETLLGNNWVKQVSRGNHGLYDRNSYMAQFFGYSSYETSYITRSLSLFMRACFSYLAHLF